ncbi:MAG TPA: hypothetical protein VKT25_10060 [Ktedonobacteraceae bacterium]|nr:hypothetical protein [Ktedonobacteraceae bacterium]
MIIWKPKILLYGWWDVEMYEALRQKLLARPVLSPPQPAPRPIREPRRGRWNRLEEGSLGLELLRYLDAYERQHKQMPSTKEIARKLELRSEGHGSYALSALDNGGWIKREFGVPRGIKITEAGHQALEEAAEAEKALVG